MASSSDIEWTEATWNPIAGCTPCSSCPGKRTRTFSTRCRSLLPHGVAESPSRCACSYDAARVSARLPCRAARSLTVR